MTEKRTWRVKSPIYDSLSFETSCYDSTVSINDVIAFMKRKNCTFQRSLTHSLTQTHTPKNNATISQHLYTLLYLATTYTSECFFFPLILLKTYKLELLHVFCMSVKFEHKGKNIEMTGMKKKLNELKKNRMEKACSMYGRNQKYVQNFSQKT
jgi:hypothetical protein